MTKEQVLNNTHCKRIIEFLKKRGFDEEPNVIEIQDGLKMTRNVAAIALRRLRTIRAVDVINKGSQGSFYSLKRAYL